MNSACNTQTDNSAHRRKETKKMKKIKNDEAPPSSKQERGENKCRSQNNSWTLIVG